MVVMFCFGMAFIELVQINSEGKLKSYISLLKEIVIIGVAIMMFTTLS